MWTSQSDSASCLAEDRLRKGAPCSPGLVSAWSHILDLTLPGPPVHTPGQGLSKRDHDGSCYQPPAASLPVFLHLLSSLTLGAVVVSANTNTPAEQHREGSGKKHGCCFSFPAAAAAAAALAYPAGLPVPRVPARRRPCSAPPASRERGWREAGTGRGAGGTAGLSAQGPKQEFKCKLLKCRGLGCVSAGCIPPGDLLKAACGLAFFFSPGEN